MCDHPYHYLSPDLEKEFRALWDHTYRPGVAAAIETAINTGRDLLAQAKSAENIRGAIQVAAQAAAEALRPGDAEAVESWRKALLISYTRELKLGPIDL